MIKRICTLCVGFLLVCSSVMADALPSAQEEASLSLSLSDCISMAYEESADLKIWEVNVQNLKKQLKDAILNQKSMKNVPIHASSNFDMIYVKNGYYVSLFRKQIELSKDEEEKIKSNLAYGVTQKYYTYKNALRLCETAQSAVGRATANLDIIKQKFALGMCTGLDVTNGEIALREAENYLLQSKNNAELAKDTLSIAIGADPDTTLNLTDTIESAPFEANLVEDTKKAMESRYDVKALSVNSELAKEYFEAAQSLSPDSTTYYSAYTKYIESTHNYTTGIKNIELLIKSSCFDAMNACSATAIAKQKLEFKKSEYEVHKLRFEMGMITNLMLTALSDELTAAEISYENALLSEKLATEKYVYQISTGL